VSLSSALRSFSLITVWVLIYFCQNNIGAKAARKMLMKLTKEGLTSQLRIQSTKDLSFGNEAEAKPSKLFKANS